MREHELYDKLSIAEEHLKIRPLFPTLNLIVFSYLTLLKDYKTLKDLSMNFSMMTLSPCITAEDFRTASYLVENDIAGAKMQIKFTQSLDPEDMYSYLFEGITKKIVGVSGDDSFNKALALARPNEKILLAQFLQTKEDIEFSKMLYTNDTSLGNQIDEMNQIVEKNQKLPIPNLTLAELYIKNNDIDKALKIVSSVLSAYPSYPRALSIAYNIYSNYLNNSPFAQRCASKLSNVSPINPYNVEKDSALSESELAEIVELSNIFTSNNPLITFAKAKLEETESVSKTAQESKQAEEEIKTEEKPEEAPKKPETPTYEETHNQQTNQEKITNKEAPFETESQDYIGLGYEAFRNKDYAKATEYFLKVLKEEKQR
jgi:tetratricopeptide (TPR) repeat protein